MNNNRGVKAVSTPIQEPRTVNREGTISAINVIDGHDERSISIAAKMGPAGRKVAKRGNVLIRFTKALQHKKDFLKTTPRRLMLATFVLASFAYAGLIYCFPDLASLTSYINSFGNYSKWIYRLCILLPMAGSTTLIAEYCILRDGYPTNSDFDFHDRFGRILLRYFDPRHHEATSAFPQHGYTVKEIYEYLSAHLGEALPADLTLSNLHDYLSCKLKIDRVTKRKKGLDKQFFAVKKLCPKTCLTCSVELVNEPSKPLKND